MSEHGGPGPGEEESVFRGPEVSDAGLDVPVDPEVVRRARVEERRKAYDQLDSLRAELLPDHPDGMYDTPAEDDPDRDKILELHGLRDRIRELSAQIEGVEPARSVSDRIPKIPKIPRIPVVGSEAREARRVKRENEARRLVEEAADKQEIDLELDDPVGVESGRRVRDRVIDAVSMPHRAVADAVTTVFDDETRAGIRRGVRKVRQAATRRPPADPVMDPEEQTLRPEAVDEFLRRREQARAAADPEVPPEGDTREGDASGGGSEHGHHGPELPPALKHRVDQVLEMIHMATLDPEDQMVSSGQAIVDLDRKGMGKVLEALEAMGVTSAEPRAIIDKKGRLEDPAMDRVLRSLEHIDKSGGLRLPRLPVDLYKIARDSWTGGPGLRAETTGAKERLVFYPVTGDSHGHAHPDMALMIVEQQPKSKRRDGWLDDHAPYEPVSMVLLHTGKAVHADGPLKGEYVTDANGKDPVWPAFEADGYPTPALRAKVRRRDVTDMKLHPKAPIKESPPPVPLDAPEPEATHQEGEWTEDKKGHKTFTPLEPGSFTGAQEGHYVKPVPEGVDDELMELIEADDPDAAENPYFFPQAAASVLSPPSPPRTPNVVTAPTPPPGPPASPEANQSTPERRQPMLKVRSAADTQKNSLRDARELSGDVYIDNPQAGLGLVFNGVGRDDNEAEAAGIAAWVFADGLSAPVAAEHAESYARDLSVTAEEAMRAEFGRRHEHYGSTTMAGVKMLDNGHQAMVMSVGADRVYRMRGADLHCLTTDVTALGSSGGESFHQVQDRLSEIATQDDLDQYGRENSYAQDVFEGSRSQVFQVMGGPPRKSPSGIQVELTEVEAGDRFVIVSGPVSKNLMDSEIERIMGESQNPAEASAKLIEAAERRAQEGVLRSRPGDMTAVVMELHAPGEGPEYKSPRVFAGVEAPRPPARPDDETGPREPLPDKAARSATAEAGPIVPPASVGRQRGAGGRQEYSVRRDWQADGPHTGFSELMHQIEDGGDNFDVPASGQLTQPQLRRLLAEVGTTEELSAVEHEVFERAQQEREDARAQNKRTAETRSEYRLRRMLKSIEARKQELLDQGRQAADQRQETGAQEQATLAPEVEQQRPELDELKDALRDIQERYGEDPELRGAELAKLRERVVALDGDPAYLRGGTQEDRADERVDFVIEYNEALKDVNGQRELEQERDQAVSDLMTRLREMIDENGDNPEAMRTALQELDLDERRTREGLWAKLDNLKYGRAGQMGWLDSRYDDLHAQAERIAERAAVGPETRQKPAELDTLTTEFSSIMRNYRGEPSVRAEELVGIGDRLLALMMDETYGRGGVNEEHDGERQELWNAYSAAIDELKDQDDRMAQLEDLVESLALRLGKMYRTYENDPAGMREAMKAFDGEAQAARDAMAERVGQVEGPTRRMKMYASVYEMAYRRNLAVAERAEEEEERRVAPPKQREIGH